MLLEFGKGVSFLLALFSFYPVLMSAFFTWNTMWPDRLVNSLPRLALAACLCFASGLLFSFPARSNPGRRTPLWRTPPMQVFTWAATGIALMFAAAWYLRCGGRIFFGAKPECGIFILLRA